MATGTGKGWFAEGRADALFCSIFTVLAVLAAKPFTEIGLIDDCSYLRTAFVFARTGRLVYNGWATAMLGWQIVWAAPFLKLFGYSFTSARMSTLALSGICVWLAHSIFRLSGINRRNANFGALTVGLSPIIAPFSVSFMSDTCGFFVILLCIYLCLRAYVASSDHAMLAWLISAGIAGTIGGTARQIAWLSVLILVPTTAWMLRRRRGALLTGTALWLIGALSIYACLQWFKHQPFAVPYPLIQGPINLATTRQLTDHASALALCLALLTLPVLGAWLTMLPRFRAGIITLLTLVALFATDLLRRITYHDLEKGFMPWTGDMIERLGVVQFPNNSLIGAPPTTFNHTGRVIASFVVIATLVNFFYCIFILKENTNTPAPPSGLSWKTLLHLLGPFAVAYTLLLVIPSAWGNTYDRYLMSLFVLALLCLLRLYQERVSARLPALSYATLVAFSIFTILGIHDWFAMHNARVAAIDTLHKANISSSQFQAGFEYDGLTQIDNAGTVVDSRVKLPAGIELQYAPPGLPSNCAALFDPHTPSVHPIYFLAFQKAPCVTDSQFDAVPYRTWLPPFQRQILILKLQSPTQSADSRPLSE
ncbi:hypothetical protein RBB77_08605 [Tunturibacter psychrotolerans]|uniref:Glycosyltransferase RgtA/B/C/D-like domain-containing protein n=1 Tax=Tunturiibacter psychrotolerans TaxID=3069686 RepID=A0AAU7ZVI2_9BACT